jgi:hypothetical protein
VVTPIAFLNAPIYSIGDTFVSRVDESMSSGSGANYSQYDYDDYGDSASEYYQIGQHSPSSVVRYENFHYHANPSSLIVEDVRRNVEVNTLDESSRREATEAYSAMDYSWGVEDFSSSSSYTYVDLSSNKLVSSTETQSSYQLSYDSGHNHTRTSQITYTYDYTGLRDNDINGPWDYSTRWGIGSSTFSNSDGDNDNFILYTKESRTQGRQGDTWQQMRVETDEATGNIVHTHISSDQYGHNQSSYSNINTNDWDGDGIIDSMSEYSSRNQNGNNSSVSIYKDDWDGDGQADYINMTRESSSRQGISRTEYTYNTDSSRPILEIKRTLDTDGDGSTESEVENAFFRTLTPRHTAMGGHAVALEDVLA